MPQTGKGEVILSRARGPRCQLRGGIVKSIGWCEDWGSGLRPPGDYWWHLKEGTFDSLSMFSLAFSKIITSESIFLFFY